MSDQQITCGDCGQAFVFTLSEQKFYESKGLAVPPKRCKACRAARKSGDGRGASAPEQRSAPRDRPWQKDAPRRGGSPGWGRFGDGAPGGRSGPPARAHANGARAPEGAAASDARGYGDRERPRRFGPRAVSQPAAGDPRPARREVREMPPRDAGPRRQPKPVAAEAGRSAEPRPRKKAERAKFDVTCVTCGTVAQVPFRPIEGRDVFCQPCYQARRTAKAPPTEPALETPTVDADAAEPT
jgi:CxxC-x17-CxxC domain-containing protein